MHFARFAAKVVLAARNSSDLDRAVQQIRSEHGDAVAEPVDVRIYADMQRLARRAIAEYGRIDAWINAAAVAVWGTSKDIPPEDIRDVMDTNFMGQVHGTKAALPWLEQTGGALICIGSGLSDRGVPLQGPYCASKHALKGWIDALRVELAQAHSPVRVTLIKPSSIDTPLYSKAKTYLGVEPSPIPPVYNAQLAVDAVRYAVEHDVRDLYVGGAAKLLSIAERLNPSVLDRVLTRRADAMQRSLQPKAHTAPNNLVNCTGQDGGIGGKFGSEAKRFSLYQWIATSKPAKVTAVMASAAFLVWLQRRK